VTAVLAALVVLAAVAVRPLAVRLWLAGLISDRALFLASVARFPAVVLVFGLIVRVPLPLLALLTVLSLVPGVLLSRVVHDATPNHPTHRE
jgi:hypothetical protein